MALVANRRLARRTALMQVGLGSIAAIFVARTSNFAAHGASSVAATAAIPPLMGEWAAAWSAHDPDRLAALYTSDAVYQEMPTNAVARGTDEIRAFVEESLATFPDIRVTPRSGFQADGWAILEGDFAAHSAEGRPISAPFAVVFELDGEAIRRSSDYFDLHTVLQQMEAFAEQAATPAS